MAIHRLSIDDFDEDEYSLIAIHTSLEDYHLAYHINRNLSIQLQKCKPDIQVSTRDGDAMFSRFTFEDADRGDFWNLFQNKTEITATKMDGHTLFEQPADVTSTVRFLPEFKRVDYFLKVENQQPQLDDILVSLKKINKVSTVYPVDVQQIKSKNNLIF